MLTATPKTLGLPDEVLLKRASRGGWAIFDLSTSLEVLVHCAADDEGLLEFVADALSFPAPTLQARPPNPGSEAKPAEHGAPPVAAPGVDEFEAMKTLSAVREALAPFAEALRLAPHLPDGRIIWNVLRDKPYGYAEVTAGDFRALLTAAGMFRDEMRPPAATAPVASTEQAEVAPPPATPHETQAPQPPTPGPATAAGDMPPSSAATPFDDDHGPELGDDDLIDMEDVGDGDHDGRDF